MILNLTQHQATPEQIEAGVVDLPQAERGLLIKLLTFDSLPSREKIEDRAFDIAELACYNGLGGDESDDPIIFTAMIGGAPYLMAPLEQELVAHGIVPLYAFSTHESVEETMPDGSVRKVNVFRHTGFVKGV